MDAARGPIKRQGLGDQFVRLRPLGLARVRQPGGEFLVMVQFGNVALVRDRHHDDFAAFFRVADGKHLDPLRGLLQLPHVAVDVLRISELVGRADGVPQHLLRRGHAIGSGQVVHQFRQEKRLGGVLVDLGRVPLVVFLRCGGRNWRRRFGGLLVGGRKRQGNKEANGDSTHDLDHHTEAGAGGRVMLWASLDQSPVPDVPEPAC